MQTRDLDINNYGEKNYRVIFTRFLILCLCPFFMILCSESGPYVDVDGTRYTESHLKDEMPEYYASLKKNYNDELKRYLKVLGERKLFERAAKEAGLKDHLAYRRTIEEKVGMPQEQEIQNLYNSFKQQGQIKDESLENVRGQLVSYIRSQKTRELVEQEKRGLMRKYNYELGPVERKKIQVNGEPTRPGSQKGALLVVEFSGYECPYCKRVQATAAQLRDKYKAKLKWVVKDYPLRLNSLYAHQATACVHKQDPAKYWQLFDTVFSSEKDRSVFQQAQMDKEVEKLGGINMASFKECVQSAAIKEEILADHQEGVRLGVRGIPYFFINGKPLSGAQPFASFDAIIQEELAQYH